MLVVFIEGLPGLQTEAKKKMVEKITAAIEEAYHLGDTLIFVREYLAPRWPERAAAVRQRRFSRCSRRCKAEFKGI